MISNEKIKTYHQTVTPIAMKKAYSCNLTVSHLSYEPVVLGVMHEYVCVCVCLYTAEIKSINEYYKVYM